MNNNQKATKRALLTSVMALVMCVVMLVGTTFAWFTDTASTAVNKIQAGTLNVALEMYDGTTWVDAEGKTLQFKVNGQIPAEGTQILWEPGCTYELPQLRVVNKGNLALKYKIQITGIQGDAKLNDVIDWTIDDTAINLTEQHLSAGEEGAAFTIKGHMQETANNDYQNLTIDGIGITVFATQDTVEKDSVDNTYDEDATYGAGATIIGLNGTYDSLTAAAKAWRESKGVVTSGSTFGMNSLGTVDSITWVVSGEVATGDGEGVIGNNGAGGSILGGGYFNPGVTVNNIIIKGVNDAKIAKTGDKYLVSAAGKNVVYENITFVDTVKIDSNPANLTFKNCKFEAGFRMPHSATNGNVTIENCTFTGNESNGYAIFAQSDNMASFKINGNTISNCRRGINVQVGNNAVVTINGNSITNIIGKTADGFTYGEAIQLTSAKTFTVTNNTISDVAVNALHIYAGCAADSIVIKDNNISAAYLCLNEANYDMSKVASSGNTLHITNPSQCVTKTGVIHSNFALN